MKRPSSTLQPHEVWEIAEAGHLELTANHAKLPDEQRLSLADTVERLHRDSSTSSFADELTEYLNGNYREVLRRLERLENASLLANLSLKVMCLLQMEARNETIGNTHPREYLRDQILKQFKQLDETDELRTIVDWLEAFCFGHELPVEFWSSAS